MLTRPYMCIHHNQSSQPEDGFSPLGHKEGTILHACNIILLLLMFSLLMLKMIMIAINVGLWKHFCSRLFHLLLQMLILSLGGFRSNAVWAFSFHVIFFWHLTVSSFLQRPFLAYCCCIYLGWSILKIVRKLVMMVINLLMVLNLLMVMMLTT